MIYGFEQGPVERKIIEECVKFRKPLPRAIANAPELQMGLELFYSGFLELTSDRQIGFALGPVPFMTIVEYCIVNGIEGEQAEDFIWVIQRLDARYLDWSRSQQDKQLSRAKSGHAKSK